jgi:2-oxoglutarate dehydrogenase E2 component (dihydrolipoamide succinyltransferase)
MPQLGESVIEGTLSRWLKAQGDQVEEYEPLLEVNTDKVDSEIPSPAAGVLIEILVPEGTTVTAGTPLAWIGEPGEQAPERGELAPLAIPAPVSKDDSASVPEKTAVQNAPADRDLGFISSGRQDGGEHGIDCASPRYRAREAHHQERCLHI